MKDIINPIYLDPTKINQLKADFENAIPCNYVVLPNFLDEEFAKTLYENFPKMDSLKVNRKSLNENKKEDYHFERFHPNFTVLKKALANPEFIKNIETITGLTDLVTTDDALGAGVHQGGPGSYVDVHIDSNFNSMENLWRRLNFLVYLNKNWKPEYGGDLELWDQKMTKCDATVPCDWNRAVIFLTDETTPHGYGKINIPEDETRKSFYTYYSTVPEEGFKYVDSHFKARPSDALGKKIATGIKEPLKLNIKRILKKIGITSLDFQDKNKKKF
jgi:Rps23 Pro-64 3,4-dihydroxylase Tpa1-like proline 4-hydroxylase